MTAPELSVSVGLREAALQPSPAALAAALDEDELDHTAVNAVVCLRRAFVCSFRCLATPKETQTDARCYFSAKRSKSFELIVGEMGIPQGQDLPLQARAIAAV